MRSNKHNLQLPPERAPCLHSNTPSSSDLKELPPELFFLPEALLNERRTRLGTRQDGTSLDKVTR